MAEKGQEVHRPGPLKQQNKPHKHGRHKSKGELSSVAKGRMSVKVMTRKLRGEMRKVDRRNQTKQIRANKRQEALMAKRAIGTEGSPPHLVVVVPLSPDVDVQQIHSLLCAACDQDEAPSFSSHSTLVSALLKQRFSLVFPPVTNLYTFLDVAKVADTLLLVYGTGVEVGPFAQLCLDCCYSQGLPATFHVIQGLNNLTGKEGQSARRAVQKAVEKRFPGKKVYSLDSKQDASNVLRYLSNQRRRQVAFRDHHAHLLAESVQFLPREDATTDCGTLKVSGYVRGRALSVNGLVHIPGLGDFQMAQIDTPPDPHPLKPWRTPKRTSAMETDATTEEGMEEDVKLLEVADPAKQESLVSEVTPDPMEGEQTWPSEEELREAETASREQVLRERRELRRVPRGTSEYQAAWIAESSSEEEAEEEGSESSSEIGEGIPPPTALSEEGESEEEEEGMSVAGTDVDTDTLTVPDTDKYDALMDLESEQKQLERTRAEREDQMFPDEVDTPLDTPTRIRFQKYRGLKSFRTSPWDPKENLPRDYARIFQFENFARTKKRVLSRQSDEGAKPGWYVTVHISNVPGNFAESVDLSSVPLVIFGLLQHENKLSVVHYVLKRTGNYTCPIKSKDQLVFHSGVRRFTACPIFSQHTAGDKHKYERFFRLDTVSAATVFAPIGYPPQPVLVFKAEGDTHILVATGSLFKVDPSRVVCKRIVLSGHLFKINRKSAVIRYMFFNREDILWFKPIELRTKYGRRGHIKEALGTHGHMKCTFDRQLKAQDTVLMNLYKRVYPKWSYNLQVAVPSHWSEGEGEMS